MNGGILLLMMIGVWTLTAGIIAAVESYAKRKKAEKQRSRELHAENCRLRVVAERVRQRDDVVFALLREEIATKDLLLRQKWREATR